MLPSLKEDPEGVVGLGTDGVLRSFDGPFTRNVIDAVALSPTQIKYYLDQSSWCQNVEDQYRGVDGRNVVGREALFNPPQDSIPPKYANEEELEEADREIERLNQEVEERVQREEQGEVEVDKCGCGRTIVPGGSGRKYDLSPREDK